MIWGDEDSRRAIEKLSPHMAMSLKEAGEWIEPKLGLEHSDMTKTTIITSEECFIQSHPDGDIFDRLIEAELGPVSASEGEAIPLLRRLM